MGDALAKNRSRDFWKKVKKVNSTKYHGCTAPVLTVSQGIFRLLGYGQQSLRSFIIAVI